MSFGSNVLAIIPARGGSKGVLRKNLRLVNGKPLIQYAIDAAKASGYINKIVVSTDDEEIAKVSKGLGVEVVVRPFEMAGDKSLVIDAIRYTIQQLAAESYIPEVILLLECTSPIKSVNEIDFAVQKLLNEEADSAATFRETAVSPNRLWRIEQDEVSPFIADASPFLPRQAQPRAYELTGQVYAFTNSALQNNPTSISILLGRVLPIITQVRSVDIDDELDLIIAEQVIKYLEYEKTI